MEKLILFGGIVALFLAAVAIQHRHRNSHAHHCLGVDMRGMNDTWIYGDKIRWIKSRPDLRKGIDPDDVLGAWEQRDKVLDKNS